jgi:hypothetical protein
MSRVFISYRRDDTAWQARALLESLGQHFDVFMDIDGMETGTSFVDQIGMALGTTRVVLVLIGPQWLAPGVSGASRLFDLDDVVRQEVATALDRAPRIHTIPILIDGAQMPARNALPPSNQRLSTQPALELQ